MNLWDLQGAADEALALLDPDLESRRWTRDNSTTPTLIYTADDLRAAAYSVLAGDPAERHIGSDRRSPFAPDHDGRTKMEVLRRAENRDLVYFTRMLLQPYSPGYRTWIDKHTGKAVDIPTPGGCRPIDVLAIARYLPAVLAHRDLSRWIERHDVLLPTQVAWRSLQLLAGMELLVRGGWSAVDVTTSLIIRAIQDGRPWIVQADLPDAFGQLPHRAFREVLAPMGMNADALDRLGELARIDAVDRGGTHWRSAESETGLVGVAQGSPLSPVLLNIALAPILRAVAQMGTTPVAHGDDIYISCTSEEAAHTALTEFSRAAHAAGIPVRPLGTTGKASRIVDARAEPVAVCRTYVISAGIVGLTTRRVRANLKDLRQALSRRPARCRVPEIVRTVMSTPLASRRWMRAVGLLENSVELKPVMELAGQFLFGSSSGTDRHGTPSLSGWGHADEAQYSDVDSEGGEGGDDPQGWNAPRDDCDSPGQLGVAAAQVGLTAVGPDPDQPGGQGQEEPKKRRQAQGSSRDGKGNHPTDGEGEPAGGQETGHPSCDGCSRFEAREDPEIFNSKLEDVGIFPRYPNSRPRQRRGKTRRAGPATTLRVTPDDLDLARGKKRAVRVILDLRRWAPTSPRPGVELGVLLRSVRWAKMATVLVHPGQRWVHEATLLGNEHDLVYERIRERVEDDGLQITLRLRETVRTRARRNHPSAPHADLLVTLHQHRADRRIWSATSVRGDKVDIQMVRTRRIRSLNYGFPPRRRQPMLGRDAA